MAMTSTMMVVTRAKRLKKNRERVRCVETPETGRGWRHRTSAQKETCDQNDDQSGDASDREDPPIYPTGKCLSEEEEKTPDQDRNLEGGGGDHRAFSTSEAGNVGRIKCRIVFGKNPTSSVATINRIAGQCRVRASRGGSVQFRKRVAGGPMKIDR